MNVHHVRGVQSPACIDIGCSYWCVCVYVCACVCACACVHACVINKVILIILCSYFQPGVVDKDGHTPLRLAVQNGKLQVVNYLIVEQNVGLQGMSEQFSCLEE